LVQIGDWIIWSILWKKTKNHKVKQMTREFLMKSFFWDGDVFNRRSSEIVRKGYNL
jgi:hypothetical protein